MIIRPLEVTDSHTVRRLKDEAGYDFEFPALDDLLIEAGCMVLDASGPLAVSVAHRVPLIELAMRREGHPAIKLQALARIHEFMHRELCAKGYTEANCFVPPEIEKSYGRRLRSFGWEPRWQGYRLKA